ncbi:hypothetical protein NBM05_04115 [Rothia sp. AR01]|uniref:Uncharacterized protein n=1 Tax=Rothia santali TaxID=2949643 RepID=A0A9X2HCK7_9MICC|nr:hypothetical protein [Rothia santali]MCP3425232.1 hypothetical protein [Rothia santali]
MSIPYIALNDGHAIPQLEFGVLQVLTRDIVPAVATATPTYLPPTKRRTR